MYVLLYKMDKKEYIIPAVTVLTVIGTSIYFHRRISALEDKMNQVIQAITSLANDRGENLVNRINSMNNLLLEYEKEIHTLKRQLYQLQHISSQQQPSTNEIQDVIALINKENA